MNILGLMSGSSLDGLDMALSTFKIGTKQDYSYEILSTNKLDFPDAIKDRLHIITELSSLELQQLDGDLSLFIGNACKDFIAGSEHEVDLIASHGHTVFHFPENGFTTQLGNGGIISQICERDVVSDFRTSDLGAGGLGAPFAPIADQLLFPDIDLLLNLGGISNISLKKGREVLAFDISPANQILNYLAQFKGLEYDVNGNLASKGEIKKDLLDALVRVNNFNEASPRALDNSWVSRQFLPLFNNLEVSDQLRTCVEFINLEVIKAIKLLNLNKKVYQMMVTGGGAFNRFLMDDLSLKLKAVNVDVVPIKDELIEFKEALLIALMGFLRVQRIPNVLSSVTGAKRDTISGCIYVY